MRSVIRPLVAVAVIGLCVSFSVHVGALLGIAVTPLAGWMLALQGSAILLACPTIMAGHLIVGDSMDLTYLSSADVHAVLQACSPAMRNVMYGFFAYALLNFAFGAWTISTGAHVDDAGTLRLFSGHWMAFFSAEAVIMATYLQSAATVARCPNGHHVSPTANFCEVCGQPVERVPA